MSTKLKRSIAAAVGLAAIALTLAACGGDYSANRAATPAPQDGTATSVDLAKTDLGKVLVDGKGRTLYLFEADKGTKSACDGACAAVWPPVTTTGRPDAGPGVAASKLGTTKRDDGSTGVTYNGHPLYTFEGDGSPGQTSGQGLDDFGAEWYVLGSAGNAVEAGE
jgi:predicted lipoprotein with Yx(FWY)xxD motif